MALSQTMLLHTDVLIDLHRRHPPARAWLEAQELAPAIPGYSMLELLFSCKTLVNWRVMQRSLSGLQIRWASEEQPNHLLPDPAPLRLLHGIGYADLLIAATAVTRTVPNTKRERPGPRNALESARRYIRRLKNDSFR